MEITHTGPETLIPVVLLIGIAALMFILVLCIWGMIFSRAGYSFAMVILMFIPLVNVIWLMIFAFSKWPIQKEVESLRMGAMSGRFPAGAAPSKPLPPGYN